MLKIAICDDDTGDRERIAEDLRVYAAAHQEHGIETTVYSSAFAMLDAFDEGRLSGYRPAGHLYARYAGDGAGAGTFSGAAKIRTFFS